MLNRMRSNEEGFTLIELLVVIAILGILAVVGVLAFSGLTDSAKTATKKTESTQVQTAVDAYLAKDSTHTVAQLQTIPAASSAITYSVLTVDGELKAGFTASQPYALSAAGDVTP